ncbi:type VI secretion system ATPase TssH, partial [Pseudomonas sp. FW305-BF6]
IGIVIGARQTQSENLLSAERERLAELESRWAEEKTLVDELLATRATLRERVGVVDSEDGSETSHALREKLVDLQQRLSALQGETPLILPTV